MTAPDAPDDQELLDKIEALADEVAHAAGEGIATSYVFIVEYIRPSDGHKASVMWNLPEEWASKIVGMLELHATMVKESWTREGNIEEGP